MSSHPESSVTRASRGTVPTQTPPSNPREKRRDPLCSDNIDAQIRWFFENAKEQAPLRP